MRIARACHNVLQALSTGLGQPAMPDWDNLGEDTDTFDAAITGVRLHLEHPGAGPEVAHEAWLLQKKLEGWVYGPTLDLTVCPPRHPGIRPFDELPGEVRAQYHVFCAVVRAMTDPAS